VANKRRRAKAKQQEMPAQPGKNSWRLPLAALLMFLGPFLLFADSQGFRLGWVGGYFWVVSFAATTFLAIAFYWRA